MAVRGGGKAAKVTVGHLPVTAVEHKYSLSAAGLIAGNGERESS